MAEFGEASQAVAGQALRVILSSTKGGDVSIGISTDSVQVARQICEIAGKSVLPLGVLYVTYKLLGQLIHSSAKKGLGGERDDQEVRDIRSGSLHVLLHCFTDERFLEVFEDYESGRMKDRLQKEFSLAGIKMEGLKVEILNIDAVKQTIAAIDVRKSYAIARAKSGASKAKISNQGFQLNISAKHGNWLTVGELIRSAQKPTSIYAEEIVKTFHKKLCNDLLGIGKCTSPDDCKQKTQPTDLCLSCQHWFEKLAKSHEKGNNPCWHKNCSSTRWPEDHWELAKFFMPTLEKNRSNETAAESTDFSALLNVLECMKDTVFLGKTRVNVDLVRNLRSHLRNTWAHAPKQELTDDEKNESFSIAVEFLEGLEKVFPKPENEECLKHLKELNDNGVANVVESELQSLLIQRQLLCHIKDEITRIKHSSDKSAIEEYEQKLDKLECALNECSQRMSDFQSLKDNINKQFINFAEELKSFRAIPDDIHEIRESIEQIHNDLAKMNNRQNVEREPTSCLPEKELKFVAREDEIHEVIRFLTKEEKAIVSLHGGPGFGKTSIAVEVFHNLSESHKIPVVFSYLSTASTIDEMILRLCRDVGVNYEDDPKSSFILWLKNIKKKVVFVLDDIDNLLEKKTDLYDFLRLMRKNSNQNCRIVTTFRSSYSISELSTAKVHVDEMDDEACMKLLKTQCPKQEDEFLAKLAELCGKVPLAMCIASSRLEDFKNSHELLQHLQQQPMKTLECLESGQYVYRAINMSYKMLDDDQKEAFVRLAVFKGNFDEEAAKAVIEKEDLSTKSFIRNLVCRSLIKQAEHRYSIHLLIQYFLTNQLKSKEEKAERLEAEALRVKALMVKYYLDLGHKLTIKSYSKDGYKANREALKKEAHNIQNALEICCQQVDTSSDISTSLTSSKIYTTSARFFSMFVRTIITRSTVDKFLQCCAKLARERKELPIKINFDCLLVEQERNKSIGKSDEYFNMMGEIKEEFEKHYEDLKADKSLCAHYYYQYGRYLSRKSETDDNQDLVTEARQQLEKSLSLREDSTDTSEGKADMVFSLLHLGNIWKMIARNEHYRKRTVASEEAAKAAEKFYREAIKLSQEFLGKHELTSACYKSLGDYFLSKQNLNMAEKSYTIAKVMRETLGLDASERHVYLLKNLGICLTNSKRPSEAIKFLEEACDMAEKLAEGDERNACRAKVYTSLAIAHDLEVRFSKNAVNYAKKALEFNGIEKIIKKHKLKTLKQILSQQR